MRETALNLVGFAGYTEGCEWFHYTGWNNYSDANGFITYETVHSAVQFQAACSVYPCGTGLLASFNAGVSLLSQRSGHQ